MKIKEMEPVPKKEYGQIIRNGVKTNTLEDGTVLYLARLGYDIELIKPTSIEKTNNPDILMFGAIWEIKTLQTYNSKTIKKRFHKASKQASKIIFDLRNVDRYDKQVEKQIIELFKGNSNVNRLILIRKSGETLDIFK